LLRTANQITLEYQSTMPPATLKGLVPWEP